AAAYSAWIAATTSGAVTSASALHRRAGVATPRAASSVPRAPSRSVNVIDGSASALAARLLRLLPGRLLGGSLRLLRRSRPGRGLLVGGLPGRGLLRRCLLGGGLL